jgi:hypothetical protein
MDLLEVLRLILNKLDDLERGQSELRVEFKAELKAEISSLETRLTDKIDRVETKLSSEIARVETTLTDKIVTLAGEIARVENLAYSINHHQNQDRALLLALNAKLGNIVDADKDYLEEGFKEVSSI